MMRLANSDVEEMKQGLLEALEESSIEDLEAIISHSADIAKLRAILGLTEEEFAPAFAAWIGTVKEELARRKQAIQ